MTDPQAQRDEEATLAAYEAELNRITTGEMVLQTVVSLVNLAGRRLGLGRGEGSVGGEGAVRDLEQARDAIDGAAALMPILQRRMAREIGPLRDAIAQLQMAYAREARADAEQDAPRQGPAESSGRLWVPGR